MDWKLFFSTFALIFFAELGDKTQLAAMASAAGASSTRAVFCGASAALVFSTFLAVVVGSFLYKYVPPNAVKIVAGLLFLLFCIHPHWSVYAPSAEAAPAPATAETTSWLSRHLPSQPGKMMSRVVMEAALQFEKHAADDYEALAKNAQNESLRTLFLTLASEERQHFEQVRKLTEAHAEPVTGSVSAETQAIPRYLWENGKLLVDDARALAAAIEHEKAKVEFYRTLGDAALIPAVKTTLYALAHEEADHMKRLQAVA
ncbi:TPA: hypothetical protein DDW35_01180 [Candidatus Sumerlaeota bacterium]|nr:hypothetical protein [Candidatus Sumerlaeota bacterium]